MLNLFKSAFTKRELFFHEDDYCQQELLPGEAQAYAESEIRNISDFADAHRGDDAGWTEVYVRPKPPISFRALGMTRDDIHAVISPHLPPFDLVYTGYGSYRERCRKIDGWGTSQQNAVFAEWDDEGIIKNVWTQFFELDEKSLSAASQAIVALGMVHSLIYVDWAWGYMCEVIRADAFTAPLRAKLAGIAQTSGEAKESD